MCCINMTSIKPISNMETSSEQTQGFKEERFVSQGGNVYKLLN